MYSKSILQNSKDSMEHQKLPKLQPLSRLIKTWIFFPLLHSSCCRSYFKDPLADKHHCSSTSCPGGQHIYSNCDGTPLAHLLKGRVTRDS